jgi:DNA repair exonuclease SbcCD ATPase subunit
VSAAFAWHERGDSLELHVEPGSLVRVELVDGHAGGALAVELPVAALHELREALVETIGDPQRAELLETVHAIEQQLGDLERDLERANERTAQLEAELRARLADLETLKSAGALADERQRAERAHLVELRGMLAGDAPQDALEVLDRLGVHS